MKTEEWLSNRTPANNFSAYVYAVRQPFYIGRTRSIRRAIYIWAFWSTFLAYNTPVLPLTEALIGR